ncbi:MAG: FixH family protein [Idiomarina sp.]|nr:FixH family protein [Idiomarina sp.]
MNQPWYKQFWPWFLISLPVTVMIVCGVIIYLSISQGNFSMVVDDYYKRGKTINAIIEHVEEAQRRNISFEFTADQGRFTLKYASGQPDELSALRVYFVHTTQAEKDFSRVLTVAADDTYRADIPQDIKGKWTITVEPYNKVWKVSEKYQLPQAELTKLRPLLYGV